MNPVIFIAVIIQSAIAKSSPRLGAMVGYLITSGILLWGLGVYAQDGWITFFGFDLSFSAFIIFCVIWYLYDSFQFLFAKPAQEAD